MLAMLVFEAALLVAVATSGSASFIARSRSRRDSVSPAGSIVWSIQPSGSEGNLLTAPHSGALAPADELLQAGTTVHTIPAPAPGPTYSPYQRQGGSAPGEYRHRKNLAAPSLQGGFQASQHQTLPNRVQHNSYRNNASPWRQANNHFQNKAPAKANGKSQYFQSPSTYRLSSELSKAQLRSGLFPLVDAGLPSFSKFKSAPAISAASVDHSSSTPANYRPSSGSSFKPLSPHRSPKRPSSPGFHSGSQGIAADPGSLQTSPEVASFVREFEKEPVLLHAGHDFQAHPSSSGFDYDHSSPRANPSGGKPFHPDLGTYQPRLLPIHSPRSTPQIPQYQAASVNKYTGNEEHKPLTEYEQLVNQPQLHFTTAAPSGLSVENTQPIIYHSSPFEQIRTDVELVNKKSTTPSPFESNENDFGGGFKASEEDFSYSSAGLGPTNRFPSKVPTAATSFELPSSNLFTSYDEAFGKYSKLASLEQGKTARRAPPKVEIASKPVHQSVEEGDSGDESSGEYRSNNNEGKDADGSYEDEDEEESRRDERHGAFDDKGAQDDGDDDDDSDEKESSYSTYGEDFEKEFEESYKQDLPREDYVHVKEVPEIEEPRSRSKQRPSTRSSRAGSKRRTRYTSRGLNDKPEEFETREYESPDTDNEARGTRTSYKSTKTGNPRVNYGSRIPRDRASSKFPKAQEKPPTKEAQLTKSSAQARSEETLHLFSTTQTPLTSTFLPIEDLQSYTFPPFDGWKAGNKLKTQHSFGASRQDVRAIFNPDNPANSFPQAHQGPLTYLSKGPRDLSGI